jgi:hypothetical protein
MYGIFSVTLIETGHGQPVVSNSCEKKAFGSYTKGFNWTELFDVHTQVFKTPLPIILIA